MKGGRFLFACFILTALALIIIPIKIANADLVQNLNSVEFWVVDGAPTNNSVTLSSINANFVGSYQLQYSIEGNGWTTVSNYTSILISDVNSQSLISMRLFDPLTSTYTNGGTLTFSGGTNGNLENSLMIAWANGATLSFQTTNGPVDKLSAVPIPASAILLGSGLLGLIGFGLRRQRRF